MERRDFLKAAAVTTGVAALGPSVAGAASHETEGDLPQILRVEKGGEKNLLEKKHAPVIEVPKKIVANEPFDLAVRVGEVIHPMSRGHYIDFIELYLNGEPAGRLSLRPEFNEPAGRFRLRIEAPATLAVREYCNLHGLWETRMELVPG